MLAPIFDFEKHSATEQYMDKLPEPVKKAIKEQRAIEGMDRDQVLLALGKPHNKSRETNKEGDELEDWMYGEPPGKVTFVTFNEGKVVKIQESYANVGGTTAPPLPSPR
jgi:outer membrane protein assembly factor BamE (lipoprotein component of BamABCDE complex)